LTIGALWGVVGAWATWLDLPFVGAPSQLFPDMPPSQLWQGMALVAAAVGLLYAAVMCTSVQIGDGSFVDEDHDSGCLTSLLLILSALVWAGFSFLFGAGLVGWLASSISLAEIIQGVIVIAGGVLGVIMAFAITRGIHRFFNEIGQGLAGDLVGEARREALVITLPLTVIGVLTQFLPFGLSLFNVSIK
jgi:hypothetical protein